MKKLLSILICVLMGVGSAFAYTKLTVNLDVCVDSLTNKSGTGGTVKLTAQPKSNTNSGSSTSTSTSTDPDISITGFSCNSCGSWFSSMDVSVTLSLNSTSKGYYFDGWYDGSDNYIQKGDYTITKTHVHDGGYTDNNVATGQDYTESYKALFRAYRYGYTKPQQINIEGVGEISVDGQNWSTSNINDASDTVGKEQDQTFTITYYARTIKGRGYTFDGWYDGETRVSGDTTHTIDITTTHCKLYTEEGTPTTPLLTAKFVTDYYYQDYATVEVAETSEGFGKVFVDGCSSDCSVDGVDEYNWSSHPDPFGMNQTINHDQFTYTYYAKAEDGFAFDCWKTADGTPVSDEDCFVYIVKYSDTKDGQPVWSAGEENKIAPPTLYAHFKTSRPYYHKRAMVGVATESEDGSVFVAYTPSEVPSIGSVSTWHTPSEAQPLFTSNEEDKFGSTTSEVIETEINENKYKYTYYAQPSANAAFYGWTIMQGGENVISSDNPFTKEYRAVESEADALLAPDPQAMYAVFRSYYHTLPRVVGVGSGQVKIEGFTDFNAEIDDKNPIQTPAIGDYTSYSFTLTAQAEEGAKFLGWSTSDKEKDIFSKNVPTCVVDGKTSSHDINAPHRITVYAIFESDIKIKHADRMIYHNDADGEYINDANMIVEVANATKITATLSGDHMSNFRICDETLAHSGSTIELDASLGVITYRLTYVGNKNNLSSAVGEWVKVDFVTYDESNNKLAENTKTIFVEELPTVTFLPADGKGSYIVSHTDGSGVSYILSESTDQGVNVEVTHESMSYLNLSLTDKPDDGLAFFGWQITIGAETTYLSYDEIFTYHFEESAIVRPEFIPETWARYIIKANPEVQYYDFNEVVARAQEGTNRDEKIVVVYQDGLLPKGNYTIPAGVTLLVPGIGPGDAHGSTEYRCVTEALQEEDFIITENWTASHYKCFRKLTIEDGTRLDVEDGANICVYARLLSYSNYYLAFPYHYGHLELGQDAVINVKDGGKLFAWGYITNSETTKVSEHNYKEVGRVNAEPGSTIWESFAFRDFRGGSATISFVDLGKLIEMGGGLAGGLVVDNANFSGFRYETFPINQYYVQNIETPLIMHSGATENLITAIAPDNALTSTTATFVGSGAGLFQWGTKTVTLTKFYDAYADRVKYIIEDNQSERTSMKLGNIGLSLNILGQSVTINSNKYVLPIQNNMDLTLKNARCEVPSGINVAFMAGSSLFIDHNSVLLNKSQIYCYDNEQCVFGENDGYVGPNDGTVYTIPGRPYGMKYIRGGSVSSSALADATLRVNGKIDNSAGYFMTTSGGSNITSDGGGEIIVQKFGSKDNGRSGSSFTRNQSIFQYNQQPGSNNRSIGFHAIPLATNSDNKFYPMLHNANGEYTHATLAGTYYYCGGIWAKSDSDPCPDFVPTEAVDLTPRFMVATPALSTYVGEGNLPQALSITEDNNNVDWSKVSWSASFTGRDANLFLFDGTHKTITFIPASAGTKIAVMILKATYIVDGVSYVHSVAVDLAANAIEQTANTLSFNDFSTLWVGQQNVALYTGKNNASPLTITVAGNETGIISGIDDGKFTAENEGTVTVTISQAQDNTNHIAATELTTTITVHPRVVWNWSELYYPSVNTNPITMMDRSTNWTLTEEIINEFGDVVVFSGNAPTSTTADTYTAEVYDLINGIYRVNFRFKQQGYDDIVFESEIYRDPRRLRVDVNSETIYRGITIGKAEDISYNDDAKVVSLTSPANENAAWTIHFLGIPDKLNFIPTGDKAWQIEESTNGITWTTTMPWTKLQPSVAFEYSLLPSTSYVRISYGVDGIGRMKDVYITELEGVKIDPTKLYIPANVGAKKHITLSYVSTSNVTITDPNNKYSASPNSLGSTTASPYYQVQDVVISNYSCAAEELNYLNIVSSSGTVQLPVQSFVYPQPLPIVLASDHAERFYYVAPQSYNVSWNESTRAIKINNAVASVSPTVTFHYAGAPSYISFNYPATAKGEWIIWESTDGSDWTPSTGALETSAGYLKQNINVTADYSPSYLRVTYNSLHNEQFDLTNLMIIGATGAFATPTELTVEYIDENDNSEEFSVTAINLASGMRISTDNPNFTLTHGTNAANTALQAFTLTSEQYDQIFKEHAMEALGFKVYFNGAKAIDYTTITVTNNPSAGEELKTLATIKVTGARKTLASGNINIYTGVPADQKDGDEIIVDVPVDYSLSGFEGSTYRLMDISSAFVGATAIFDYLFLFGETTTMDGSTTINTPTTIAGSNAKTPCYIYKKNTDNVYELLHIIENANASTKVPQDFLNIANGTTGETLRVYVAGFCPYASTGYTKQDEGVFFFTGDEKDHVHVYLEDCYLYSRAKTEDGHFFENRSDGRSFTENYVKGSGAILVFECATEINNGNPFQVTIHTRKRNLLKSHYGCFLESVAGRAFQASSPVQIHMKTSDYITASYTTLNFTDEWPTTFDHADANMVRTNGFLSLKKQVNNAPSIDLGNANTVVNFNGGQVELQNAQNVSDNYTTTMAISFRSGRFAGFLLAYGMGSDDVGGTVNFKDGTTTVERMKVDERYRQYYLMEENGTHTSCLRCPQNTYVYGGSHCMMRACSKPTSTGGAPTNGPGGAALGLYKYPKNPESGKKGGWSANGDKGLVTPTAGNVPDGYGVNSVTPNTNGTDETSDDFLNFWVTPDYDSSVKPEIDQKASFWKACMTYIEARIAGYGGNVGGDVVIGTDNDGNQTEKVSNFLYCVIDENIQQVITDNYSAPVKSPLPSGDPYLYVQPSQVGDDLQHYVLNGKTYKVDDKIYYITTARADIWQTFTAPFDVENVYIMETRHEQDLALDAKVLMNQDGTLSYRNAMEKLQAKHNADFAAFFGVAMAIHPNKTFDQIFQDYIGWAKAQDGGEKRRDKYLLKHFYKDSEGNSNWNEADYYLYKNTGDWTLDQTPQTTEVNGYTTKWDFVTRDSKGVLMKQGDTYLMQFPYCTGCFAEDGSRDFWDYWSGKFLIFESTDGPHDINGSEFVGASAQYNLNINTNVPEDVIWIHSETGIISELATRTAGDDAAVSGNSTFALMGTESGNVLAYNADIPLYEGYTDGPLLGPLMIEPTQSFIYTDIQAITSSGQSLVRINHDGTIVYKDNNGNQNGTSGGHIPTVGGGNDLFVTSIAGGVNVAVAAPQNVRVLSSTGAVIYSGYIQTAVDIQLPTTGIYIVSGENEVQKILY